MMDGLPLGDLLTLIWGGLVPAAIVFKNMCWPPHRTRDGRATRDDVRR